MLVKTNAFNFTMRPSQLLSVALLVPVLCGTIQAAADKPNIVIFLVDDMGLMDTSVPFITDAQGRPQRQPLNEFYRTPSMQQMAEQGVRFTQFYAQSVCSPTRASLMTGQNATRHRTTNFISPQGNNRGSFGPPDWNYGGLTAKDVTLPRLLQTAGWRTIHVGKGHFGPPEHPGADPRTLGFDVNIAGAAAGQPGSYLAKSNFGNKPGAAGFMPGLEKYYGTDTFLTEALTLEAMGQIDGAIKDQKPFLLYMAHYAVHSPFTEDPRFSKDYAKSDKPEKAKKFATMIAGMDKSLGDILEHLRKRGVAENTLVIFLGDNGTDAPLSGGDHGKGAGGDNPVRGKSSEPGIFDVLCAAPLRGKKATHYEGGMRVPFIAAWAQPQAGNTLQARLPITAGAVQTQVGTVMDILPTVLELAGVANPANHPIDGASLKPLFAGKRDDKREESFLMHYPHGHRSQYFTSFRLGSWKVVYHYFPEMNPAQTRYELFDLATDLSESNNRAEQEPERLRTMMQAMVKRLEAEGALYPVGKEDKTPLRPIVP
jgi:arylsulfatase A-like enzyme